MRTFPLIAWLLATGCDPSVSKDSGDKTAPTPLPDGDHDDDGFVGTADGGNDCDDDDPSIRPDAAEQCNGIDDDCNGQIDDDPTDAETGYTDADGDGFGDASTAQTGCELPDDLVDDDEDCDDQNPDIYPDADEFCNGIDDDCSDRTVEAAERAGRGYSSIQDALDDAADGDVIELCDGTFTEDLTSRNDVTIVSRNGRDASILDGEGTHSLITVATGDLTLTGLTLRNASGGAVRAQEAGSGVVTVTDVLFDNNTSDRGGAIAGGVVVVTDSDFLNNRAIGAGLLLGGAIQVQADAGGAGSLDITDCTFEANLADYGASIYAQTVPTTVTDSTFTLNVSNVSAGGIYQSQSTLTLTNVTFEGNSAAFGGGVLVDGGVVIADADTLFLRNTVTSNGGGAYASAGLGNVDWTGGSFVENHSDSAGGGIMVDVPAAFGGAVQNEGAVRNLVVDDNDATVTGGGIYLIGAPMTFEDSLVTFNRSDFGAGSSVNETGTLSTTVRRVSYFDNVGGHGGGTDLYLAVATFEDCVFARNQALMFGGGIFVEPFSLLTSVSSDFSAGPDDNAPEDVWLDHPTTPIGYQSFDVDSSFSCTVQVPECI